MTTQRTPRPVLIVFSVLAGMQILNAGSVLTDVAGAKTAATVALLVAAAQAGMAFYVQGEVVPYGNVAAHRDNQLGYVVAGPSTPTGIKVGEPVEVLEAKPTQWT